MSVQNIGDIAAITWSDLRDDFSVIGRLVSCLTHCTFQIYGYVSPPTNQLAYHTQ